MKHVIAALIALVLPSIPALAQNNDRFITEARAMLERATKDDHFFGTVLVALDGKPIFREGFGFANREWGVANTPDTKFRIASITKQFTAAAILKLAEDGKLSLSDPVSKYYTRSPASWQKITLQHLLTHTSGIPSYADIIPNFFQQRARNDLTPEQILQLIRDQQLQFEPGTDYRYSNSGYIILGYVIEKITGERYADYLNEQIFEPLGMKNTGFDQNDIILSNRAAGYDRRRDGTWRNAAYIAMTVPFAAGSLYSTVDDLLIWNEALRAGKVLNQASFNAMSTDYGHHYGFGLTLQKEEGHAVEYHSGGINGFTSMLSYYPADQLTVIVMENSDTNPADAAAFSLAKLYFAALGNKPIQTSDAALNTYGGSYRNGRYSVVRVMPDGDHLSFQMTGEPISRLAAFAPGKYFQEFGSYDVQFKPNKSGRVTSLILEQDNVQALPKIDEGKAQAIEADLKAHLQNQIPTTGDKEVLQKQIAALLTGKPDYNHMTPALAADIREQLPQMEKMLHRVGPLKSIMFTGVARTGADIYWVTFENGATEWRLILGEDGKVEKLAFRPPV